MSTNNRFKVILEGTILPEFEREKVQKGLAELFHSSEEKMEGLLRGEPVPLKKQYDRIQAATICQKIRQIGAQCRFEEIPVDETAPGQEAARARRVPHPCPVCRNPLGEFDETCSVCGFVEGKEEREVSGRSRGTEDGMADERGSPANGSAEENDSGVGPASVDSREQTGPDRLQALLNRYVRTNTTYYENQFARFGSLEKYRFAISWHWPAFFFFFFWALYRKLWVLAGIHIILSLGLTLFIQPGVLYLLWALVWPVTANFLYFQVAASNVKRAVHEPEYEARLDALGGVSRPAAGLGVLIFIIVVIFTSNHLTDQLVEQYGEHVQEVLPGSGSQIRGDGSTLEKLVDRKSKLALTSLKLSYLGTSLKILLLAEDNPENRDKITTFERQFTTHRVLDSWGQPFQIEQQVERYILKSAGPDRTFNTDDDILQLITHEPSF